MLSTQTITIALTFQRPLVGLPVQSGLQMREGTIDANGTSVHYVQDGDGPDIVWVPAGDQTCDVYHEQLQAFRDRYWCTSFDPRGAGTTVPRTDPPWPIAEFAADCAELIRQVCTPPVVLTGLSLGALITQEVALQYPKLLRVAIPMGTIARKTGFGFEWETAEIDMASKGINMPADFSVIHYANETSSISLQDKVLRRPIETTRVKRTKSAR
jgi:pimeloyl-ACP methyl ester carboxylesterase